MFGGHIKMSLNNITGKDRIKSAITFLDTDRVPVSPLYNWGTAGLLGITVEEFAKNSGIQAKSIKGWIKNEISKLKRWRMIKYEFKGTSNISVKS